MKKLITIIIPTYNNRQFLHGCLHSILYNRTAIDLFRILIINNGHKDSLNWIEPNTNIEIIHAKENLGWEGGLKLGLKHSKSPYVMFSNDDIHLPAGSKLWLNLMLQHFRDSKVAAVGPESNCVMGPQNMFANIEVPVFTVKYLIGFCVLLDRKKLDEVGGIELGLPGGDDFDLSIRLRKAGYKLIADKRVFVFHHGFKTGERLYGNSNVDGGWNSWKYQHKVNTALIQKHGLKEWYNVMGGLTSLPNIKKYKKEDKEGDIIRKHIKGKKIIELGVGGQKTVKEALGIDIVPKDQVIETIKTKSVADIKADVSKELPIKDNSIDTIIARHILEHLLDTVKVLNNWKRVLKKGGRLIIAVPNQNINNTIPMNPEHVHAFTPENLKTLLEITGYKVLEIKAAGNWISFVAIVEKI